MSRRTLTLSMFAALFGVTSVSVSAAPTKDESITALLKTGQAYLKQIEQPAATPKSEPADTKLACHFYGHSCWNNWRNWNNWSNWRNLWCNYC
jgi:hypothetical protein